MSGCLSVSHFPFIIHHPSYHPIPPSLVMGRLVMRNDLMEGNEPQAFYIRFSLPSLPSVSNVTKKNDFRMGGWKLLNLPTKQNNNQNMLMFTGTKNRVGVN